ncbi:hypothetical protein GX51_03754 [Blastomyces parvus]|uniref:Uncharacterized protein n=1 Tax=Blastomyces parvus TaxID=2060905 RepID=A0A2B7X5H6_9EURO|nr:hypothetical protein GX51_03754 [Blastomyces parvus]
MQDTVYVYKAGRKDLERLLTCDDIEEEVKTAIYDTIERYDNMLAGSSSYHDLYGRTDVCKRLLQTIRRVHRLGQTKEQKIWILSQRHSFNRSEEFNFVKKMVHEIAAKMAHSMSSYVNIRMVKSYHEVLDPMQAGLFFERKQDVRDRAIGISNYILDKDREAATYVEDRRNADL